MSTKSYGWDIRFKHIRNGGYADASSKIGKIYFSNTAWKYLTEEPYMTIYDKNDKPHLIPNMDLQDIEQIPAVVSHETLHHVIEDIEDRLASHALDNYDFFGYMNDQSPSGIDEDNVESVLNFHEAMQFYPTTIEYIVNV
jgi:hypothetical protein